MRNCILFIFVVAITFINPLKSQTLGTDISGNSPLVHQGGSAYADVMNANFGASFFAFDNNLYYRQSTLFGVTVNGSDRAGMAAFLNNGITAPQASAAFTVGMSKTNNFINRYKPRAEYWALLDEEDLRLTSRMNALVKDSNQLNKMLESINKKFPAETDTLKQLFFSIETPSFEQLKLVWIAYAKAVTKTDFYNEVISLLLGANSEFTYLFTEYKDLKQKHEQIILQKQTIDKPVRPFVQNILYLTTGLKHNGFYQIDSQNNAINVIFNNITSGFVAIGGSHCFGNRVFLGYQIGQTMLDNFEALAPMAYDTTKTATKPQATATRSYQVYTGTFNRFVSPFFSFHLALRQKVGKIGHAIITPVQFTYSAKSTIGASVQLITNSGVSVGATIENRIINDARLKQPGQETLSQMYFGFRLGLMLADFDFLN